LQLDADAHIKPTFGDVYRIFEDSLTEFVGRKFLDCFNGKIVSKQSENTFFFNTNISLV